ncbi:unnamed protein product, partial [Prorocentrum cordatum]
MRVGMDVDGLCEHASWLEGLLRLDPRGGFFDHIDVAKGFYGIMKAPAENVTRVRAISRATGYPVDGLHDYWALKTRVMLSHLRIKKKERELTSTAIEKAQPELRSMLSLISRPSPSPPAKPSRSAAQQEPVQNPFINYRVPELFTSPPQTGVGFGSSSVLDSDGDDDDEDNHPIFCHFDGRAIQLVLSNGSAREAEWFRVSGDGFVMGVWDSVKGADGEPYSWESELSADWLG